MEIFDWKRLLLNDLPPNFLLEVLFRSIIMFTVLLLALKIAGKRGVKQLSVFETVIIISLGSAAGDPMLYDDVGLLPAITVVLTIILFYKGITWLTGFSPKFEQFMEGKIQCIIDEGEFSLESIKKESLAQDEFFLELRIKSIEHLGQIKNAYIETNGEISTFYYPDDQVKYGLPILPQLFDEKSEIITEKGIYACSFCGNIQEVTTNGGICENCNKKEWVRAIKTIRIS
ncbi:DUF421 domain-containing protein [Flavobacterium sp. 7A]|uniref:DUF421 domain-containing protein n=1 Tax=Flavobacterium sp. 7A TaxID=2940571 RepID=UPI002227853F|nr:YetF domain-containing protein [Flavobacterium sp. 7A]MCW2121048.1 uncharacterized membrane protein YcaP (DUF421 family) [Flavobacterium sp. 7A]